MSAQKITVLEMSSCAWEQMRQQHCQHKNAIRQKDKQIKRVAAFVHLMFQVCSFFLLFTFQLQLIRARENYAVIVSGTHLLALYVLCSVIFQYDIVDIRLLLSFIPNSHICKRCFRHALLFWDDFEAKPTVATTKLNRVSVCCI